MGETCLAYKVIIHKSFRSYGISIKLDGTADDGIHCIKSWGVAESAAVEIAHLTVALKSAPEEDNFGPFADLDDEEEREDNEVVVEEDGSKVWIAENNAVCDLLVKQFTFWNLERIHKTTSCDVSRSTPYHWIWLL